MEGNMVSDKGQKKTQGLTFIKDIRLKKKVDMNIAFPNCPLSK